MSLLHSVLGIDSVMEKAISWDFFLNFGSVMVSTEVKRRGEERREREKECIEKAILRFLATWSLKGEIFLFYRKLFLIEQCCDPAMFNSSSVSLRASSPDFIYVTTSIPFMSIEMYRDLVWEGEIEKHDSEE